MKPIHQTPAGQSMGNEKPNTLDVTGLLCPLPVLRARRKLDSLNQGDTLVVTASDPVSVQDMPAFCAMAGHKLVIAYESGGAFVFEIQKGAAN